MNTDELKDPLSSDPPEPESDQASFPVPEADASEPEPISESIEESPVAEGPEAPAAEAAVAEAELGAEAAGPESVEVTVVAEPVTDSVPVAVAEDAEEPAEPVETYDLPQALFDAGIDVEAALGALSFEPDEADEVPSGPRLPPFTPPNYRPALPAPRPLTLRRGSPGSLVPALFLIGIGAWLTVANVTHTPVNPLLFGAVVSGGIVLSLVAAWLGNGRWSRGLVLVVLLALFSAGGGVLISNAGMGSALTAYPLILSALGVAILLAALLARPRDRGMLGPAIVFIAAGIVGYLVLNGAVPAGLVNAASLYWFVPAVLLLILVALPLFVRRRSSG